MLHFAKLSLKHKVLIFIGFIFIVSSIGGVFSFKSFNHFATETQDIIQVSLPIKVKMNELNSSMLMMRRHEKDFIMRRADKYVQQHKDEQNNFKTIVKDSLDLKSPLFSDEQGKAILNEAEQYIQIFSQIVSLIESKKETVSAEEIQKKVDEMREHIHAAEDIIKKTIANADVSVQQTLKNNETTKRNLILTLLGVFAIVVSTIVGFSIYILKLTAVISQLTLQVANSSKGVRSTSNNIHILAKDLSNTSIQQSSHVTETSSAVHEISSMVSKNTENVNQSLDLSHNNINTVKDGLGVVNEMIQAMALIKASNDDVAVQMNNNVQAIENIVQTITEIENKTKVINDIVFQTKLLSFNASVEAARAGENGKGFAVVAEEVGGLADLSGKASKEISELLTTSVAEVKKIAEESKSNIQKVLQVGQDNINKGEKVAHACGESFNLIFKNIEEVNSKMNNIAEASKEQSLGVQEISKSVEVLAVETTNVSKIAQSSETAVQELTKDAEGLDSIVESLNTVIYGQS